MAAASGVRSWPVAAQMALTALLYLAAARFGQALYPLERATALLWPSSGLTLLAVLQLGPRVWPGIAVGALVAFRMAGEPWASAAMSATGCTLEPLLAANLLARVGFERRLGVRDVLVFVSVASLLTTMVSATIGTAALSLGHESSDVATVWREWWFAEALGTMIVTPLGLSLERWQPLRERRFEALLLVVVVITVSIVVFGAMPHTIDPLRHAYLLFPVIIWAAMRFEHRGTAVATFIVYVVGLVATARGYGPFASALLSLQSFVGVLSGAGLILSAVISERARATRTIRDQHEDNERLLREAEAAVRARDEFLSIASHELRTPLSALVLQLEVLDALSEANDKMHVKVERAMRATARLRDLIDRLLDVSRIVSERPRIERARQDLIAIVRGAIAKEANDAKEARVEVTLEAPRDVIGDWDAPRIEQVLIALLSNAIKYGRAQPVTVAIEADEARATVAVRDRGIGIAPDDLERIFVRFERAAPPSQYGGLGLGLYVTHQIVEAHGGTVRAVSERGQGATFFVTLPRWAPQ